MDRAILKNDLQKFGVAMIIVGSSMIAYYNVTKEERAKRYAIAEKTREDVDAINRAASVMVDRIRRGVYNGKSLDEIHQEFAFEQIAQHEDLRP